MPMYFKMQKKKNVINLQGSKCVAITHLNYICESSIVLTYELYTMNVNMFVAKKKCEWKELLHIACNGIGVIYIREHE